MCFVYYIVILLCSLVRTLVPPMTPISPSTVELSYLVSVNYKAFADIYGAPARTH